MQDKGMVGDLLQSNWRKIRAEGCAGRNMVRLEEPERHAGECGQEAICQILEFANQVTECCIVGIRWVSCACSSVCDCDVKVDVCILLYVTTSPFASSRVLALGGVCASV